MVPVRDLFETHLTVLDLLRSMAFFGQSTTSMDLQRSMTFFGQVNDLDCLR